jgi:hypothetical protein
MSRLKKIRRLSATLPILSAILFALSTPADLKHKPWIEKDWTKWGVWDCENILEYSPWAWYSEGGGRATGPTVREGRFGLTTLVQLRSALPIRQALLRQLQLQKHYEWMNAQKKDVFDQEHAGDVAEAGDGSIVVYFKEGTWGHDSSSRLDIGASFVRQAALLLSDGTFLIPVRTSVDPIDNSGLYAFPRTVNGKPVFTTADKEIVIVLGEILPKVNQPGPVDPGVFRPRPSTGRYSSPHYSFSIASLMYKGKLEY